MLDYDGIRALAKEMKAPTRDLLTLADVQLRQQLIDLRERAQGLWEQIADDLLEAPYVSADDVPEPREESHQLAPLFDSGRDYLTQIDWYRRWQGRAAP